jgi:tungstate transport system substrate-binding protein
MWFWCMQRRRRISLSLPLHGVNRRDVMWNDFVIAGPASDPSGIKSHDALQSMRKIADGKVKFISRGDNSGTDQMEQAYWARIGKKPTGPTYISAALGMGAVLSMAAELGAYTLTDRATYAAYRAKTGLDVIVEGDPIMRNPYGIIAVNPAKYKDANYRGAMQLIEWITSQAGRKKMAEFKVDGQALFFPAQQP